MNNQDDPPDEAPAHRSLALSPVSPKPLHFPSPQSIPVLQNQMDPIFNDTANHPQTPPDILPPASNANPEASTLSNGAPSEEAPADAPVDEVESDYSPDPDQSAPAVAHVLNEPSIDASLLSAAPSETRAETADISSHEPAPAQAILTEPESTQIPSEPTVQDAFRSGEASPMDIQRFLDQLISGSTPASNSSNQQYKPPGTEDQSTVGQNELVSIPQAISSDTQGDLSRSLNEPATQNASPMLKQPENQTSTPQISLPVPVPNIVPTPQSFAAPPNPSAGAPGTNTEPSLQQMPAGLGQTSTTGAQIVTRNQDEDTPWDQTVQKLYDDFLADERRYVADGQWEKFPMGSRLFIGNLSSERVTKRDIFHVFHKHGKLAQISIKQAFGFVQFLNVEDCNRALRTEEGVSIRGRKIHLEISKPQKNTGRANNNQQNNARRRSRSPESRNGQRADRYRGDSGRNRGRDDYRPDSRDSYRVRSPDRYDARRRSRSPPRRDDRDYNPDYDLPLPRRAPHQVPDLQIIAKDGPDTAFLRYVQDTFERASIKADTLLLSPRLDEPAVVRRQILEGVLAVMLLTKVHLASQRYDISIFDRSAGQNNVRFEEYKGQDLSTCVALMARAKQSQPRPASTLSQYGLPITPAPPTPSYAQQPAYPPPLQAFPSAPMHAQTPSLPTQQSQSSVIPGMDPKMLSQLLGTFQQPSAAAPNQQRPPMSAYPGSPGFPNAGTQQYPPLQPQQNNAYSAPQWGQPPQAASKGTDVQSLMQQLSRYGRSN